ncbi:MAG: amino acid racemase [Marinilabiliaceae bacterium]|jgi:aspartate racemase|nr:amino acid racemase [Marinilabiliaceae bacterium]
MARLIGVVGGMGTDAGIDLLKKIAGNTPAVKDQDHLPVIMISKPASILDRTEYLFGEVDVNPGFAISSVANELAKAGAELLAIPCNTAHVPEIIGIVENKLAPGMRIVNMIEEVGKYIADNFKVVKKVGILGTNGVYRSGVYDQYLYDYDIVTVYPNEVDQFGKVHPSVYDPFYGIKAVSNPVSDRSVADLLYVSEDLIERGAELIILGCTEIPLALTEDMVFGVPLIDANNVLAKALVRESSGSA